MAPLNHLPGLKSLLFVAVPALLAGVVLATEKTWRKGAAADQDGAALVRQGEEMDRQMSAVIRRLERKDRLVRALLGGRLTLLEAAALFRALNQAAPAFYWGEYRKRHVAESDEERHCREVINCVYIHLRPKDPAKAKEVPAGLGRELAEHLSAGPLRLPDVEPLLSFLDDAN
jgi:hypothetical protein